MKAPIVRALILAVSTIGLVGLPLEASMPPLQITIDSGAPYFVPVSANVPSGTAIHWTNPTASPHTITHMGCVDEEGRCMFDSGTILPDGQFTVPGLPPGRYPYYCQLHPIMRGMLVVTDSQSGSSET
ncbi:Cupredoxin domain-containing protein [Nitrospira tepida]|uniref:Cupredoxin domain-containing protein n=1 Tax=Nitrospira tepida TaxID=2973512 RepID=A0AA86MYK7_9BACT|nr:cupredoxin domain-containing protein [Nitrospira tepida]CAI4031336.1 Cupredoxin domain-containing protein [Nitrospira tepida]